MSELHGLLDAVSAFETGITAHFGLERSDLKWFAKLAEAGAEAGMSAAEIVEMSALPVDRLEAKLETLTAAGHVQAVSADAGSVVLTASARKLFAEAYARIETAYVGLHRYGAEELGVVRTFLRVGRHFYERQTERFERAVQA